VDFCNYVDASKSGVTAEGLKQASKSGKRQISLQEAQMILGVDSNTSWEDIMERYKKMYEANEKNGSFYILSKIYRAQERLKDEFEEIEDEKQG
jgi:import inner membrane translocase subunit TIM16